MLIHQKNFGNKIAGIFEGIVMSHNVLDREDSYMAVKIWVQGLHPEEFKKEENYAKLPTAVAAAPIFGLCDGSSGLFSKPAVGTIVYCFAVGGDPNDIVYFAVDYEHNYIARTNGNALPVYTGGFAVMRQGGTAIEMLTDASGKNTLKLSAGKSFITLNSKGEITINADKIEINAGASISLNGQNNTSVSIDDNGKVLVASPSNNVSVASDSLSMDTITFTKKIVTESSKRLKSRDDAAVSRWKKQQEAAGKSYL